MTPSKRQLIISFIGNTDLKALELPSGPDQSPILRLLASLPNLPKDEKRQRRLVLLDDDRDGMTLRAQFCERLPERLVECSDGHVEVVRHPVTLPEGPTDLSALYEQVWQAIPTSGPNRAAEIIFHLTSGTPAMQLTLMLASQSLRLGEARLFETSREQGVRELKPPYALALRRQRERERLAYGTPSLPEKARPGLLKHSILADPQVESAYAALYKAATNRKQPQRVLIQGATGSGKWHAARQFAHWRRDQHPLIWSEPAACPALPEGATLLIRWLDAWPEAAWRNLAALADERPDLAMVATVRTDRLPPGGLERLTTDALRGAVAIDLLTLAARSDLVALAESLARQLGSTDGKLKERLQHDLLTDHFPHNLHDLKTRLATANAASPGQHPERKAYLQARDRHQAQQLLDRAWQAIASLDFGTGHLRLDEALDAIRLAVVQRSLAEGRSQKDAGEQLGLSQQTVSDILKTELSPYLYPAEREHAD